MEHLWPDSDPDASRLRLRTALATLRKLLESPPIPAGSVLDANRELVRLQADVTTDLQAFDASVRTARRATSVDARVAALEGALAVCAGELLSRHDEEPIREARFEHSLARESVLQELAAEYRRAGLLQEAEMLLASTEREWGSWAPRRPELQFECEPVAQPSLPPNLTRFFGRKAELDWIAAHLAPKQEPRIVSLIGLGGTGKTRLALEAGRKLANDYEGKVWLVDASEARTWDELGSAVVHAIVASPESSPDVWKQALNTLSVSAASLLILDNCEQLPAEEPACLYRLLDLVPGLHILATSRLPFAQTYGLNYDLGPLEALPGSRNIEGLATNPAANMLVDRSRKRKPDFGITQANYLNIWEIVSRLEGIPLSIELAAAWASTLTTAEMARRLENPLDILVSDRRDTHPRHKSVRNTFEWSLGLLDEESQAVLFDLSVFAGGWDIELAQAVLGRARTHVHLKALIDASLIRFSLSESGGRYSMLESLRQLAWAKLGEARREELRANHLIAMSRFAKWASAKLSVTADSWIFKRIDNERDNLKVAIEAATEHPKGAELGLGIVADLGLYWQIRCRFTEGIQLMRAALALPGGMECGPLTCRTLVSLAIIVRDSYDYQGAVELSRSAVAYAEKIGDPAMVFSTLNCLATVLILTGPEDEARLCFERGLAMARELNEPRAVAVALVNLAPYVTRAGRFAEAREMLEEAHRIDLSRGNEGGAVLVHLAELSLREGDAKGAEGHFVKFLTVSLANGYPGGWCLALRGLAKLRVSDGSHEQAVEYLATEASGRQENEIRLASAELDDLERLLANCRDALGDDRFEQIWRDSYEHPEQKLAEFRGDSAT